MKRKVLGVIVTFALIASFFAFSGTMATSVKAEEDASDLKLLYVSLSANNEFFTVVSNGFTMKCNELGITPTIQAPTSTAAAEEQLQFIENAIANGIDGIIVSPSSSDGIAIAVKHAQDAGIPLVCVDSGVTPETAEAYDLEYVPFVGTDNVEAGRMVARWIQENFPAGTKTILIEGLLGHTANTERLEGLWEVLGDDYLEVVADQNGDWEMEPAYNAMQNILTAHSDAELVITLSDGMGIGAQNALKEKGLSMPIISVNGDAEALVQIAADTDFKATIAQYPGEMGEVAVELINEWITTGTKPAEATNTGIVTVDKDGVDAYNESVAKYYN